MAGLSAPAVDFFSKDDTPHGYCKRVMWMKYLQAFVAKTQNRKYNTLIYDGFAGVGVYGDNWSDNIAEYGSPLIAMHVSIQYFIRKNKTSHSFLPCPPQEIPDCSHPSRQMEDYSIQLYLVEEKNERFKELVKNVGIMFNSYDINCMKKALRPDWVEIFSDDVSISLACSISCNSFDKVDPPTMVQNDRLVSFIDPFGYKHIPIGHVCQFIGFGKEIFINFMSQFVNRFFDVDEEGVERLFGMHKDEIELQLLNYDSDRLDNIMSLYKDSLRNICQTDAFPLSFEMRNSVNTRLYHMIFISCHEKGLEAMKEAMNTCSQDPKDFRLSDYFILKKGQQMNLINGQINEDVAQVIFQRFNGESQVSINTVRQFVIHDTIFVWRKGPLNTLFHDGKITHVANNNNTKFPKYKGTFPDDIEWFLTFCADGENVYEGIDEFQL